MGSPTFYLPKVNKIPSNAKVPLALFELTNEEI